jgi:integrase
VTSFWSEPRTAKDGTVTHRVLMQRGGRGGAREVVMNNISTEPEAKRIIRDLKKRARLADAGLAEEVSPTVGLLIDTYLDSIATKPCIKGYRSYAKHLAPLRHLELKDVERAVVVRLVTELDASGVGAEAIKKAVGILRTAIARARDLGVVNLVDNPARAVKTPKAPRRKKMTLSPAQARTIIPYLDEDYRPFMGAAILTGLRPSELAALRAEDIDGDRLLVQRSLTRDVPKDGDDRIVPLSPEALQVLRVSLERTGGPEIFSPKVVRATRDTDLATVLRRAIRRAVDDGHVLELVDRWELVCRRKGCGHMVEVDSRMDHERCAAPHPVHRGEVCGFLLQSRAVLRPIRFYDLRGTTATLLFERGVPINLIGAILGHSEEAVTLRSYVDGAEAMRRLSLQDTAQPFPPGSTSRPARAGKGGGR